MAKTIIQIKPSDIVIREKWNPRHDFEGEEDLIQSIVANGVRMPISVYKEKDKYVLIDGERRVRACLKAVASKFLPEEPEITAYLEPKFVEREALYITLVSNDGKPLLPVEEAYAYERLRKGGESLEEIARKVGRTAGHISSRLKLLAGTEELKTAVAEGKIGTTLATKLLKKKPEEQKKLVKEATTSTEGKKKVEKRLEKKTSFSDKLVDYLERIKTLETEIKAYEDHIKELEETKGINSGKDMAEGIASFLNRAEEEDINEFFETMNKIHPELRKMYKEICEKSIKEISVT
jgi:ParB family chromosome partitioning protein